MDNSIPKEANILANMVKQASALRQTLEQLKSGDGLGFNEEQKVKFKEQLETNESVKSGLSDFDSRMAELQDMVSNVGKPKQ